MSQQEWKQLFEWYEAMGITYSYSEKPRSLVNELPSGLPSFSPSGKPDHMPFSSPSSLQTLEELRQALEALQGCPLKEFATNLVFGEGNPNAEVMLVGEAPGADEDRQGKPFVGMSGQLLSRMLKAIHLQREEVYITNIVPWRPPGNRQPTTSEIAVCYPFIQRHIELIRPKILVCLGGVAAKTLWMSQEGIVRLRGQWRPYHSEGLSQPIPSLALFHPAYLLRSPNQKALAWRDLLMIRRALDKNKALKGERE